MGTQHIPKRRCLGCGAHAPKRDLARFVAVPDADGWCVVRDDRAKHPGRGMYICPARACFDKAVERRAFLRASRRDGGPMRIDTTLADGFDG